MVVLFSYAEIGIVIDSVSVIFYDTSTECKEYNMVANGPFWQCEIDLPSGEHLYKFLINGELPLYDSNNNLFDLDPEGELWSLLMIDKSGNMLTNSERYHVTISQYKLSAHENSNNLGAYRDILDEKITATVVCTNINGIHGLTAAWYAPDDTLFEYSENPVCSEQPKEQVSTIFWLNRTSAIKRAGAGLWKLYLFLDGRLVLRDHFLLSPDSLSDGIYNGVV